MARLLPNVCVQPKFEPKLVYLSNERRHSFWEPAGVPFDFVGYVVSSTPAVVLASPGQERASAETESVSRNRESQSTAPRGHRWAACVVPLRGGARQSISVLEQILVRKGVIELSDVAVAVAALASNMWS